jgi:hypothetical protein
MSLTLISAEQDFVVFEAEDGDEILMTRGPIATPLVYWDDFDLADFWQNAVAEHRARTDLSYYAYRPDRGDFVTRVRQAVADLDSVNVVWCESCDEPVKLDEAEAVNGDYYACSSCYEEHYRSCDDCGRTVYYEDMIGTLSEEYVCQRCCDRNYSFCEECDGYYHSSYSDEHDHNGGCDCESPAQTFAMRNDGEPVVNQDERVTIALPAGVISEEGIHSIVRLVREHYYALDADSEDYESRSRWWNLSHEVYSMDARWQTKEGNFTKRLSKLAHKSQGLKVPPAMLSAVGCIARDNSHGSELELEFTRNLNLSAADFYHEDSCWWQSYSESRCALKTNGGIGMRTFQGDGVTGRAWVMPLRADEDGGLEATFDSLTPDAFMVFNGYGDLSGYTPARIVAHMAGLTYRKIEFGCSPMYVNGGSGYLVASEEIASKYAEAGNLHLYVDTHSTLHHREQSTALAAA